VRHPNTVDIWRPMVFNCAMATRLRRAQVVERNREAVLNVARRVFIERGYAGATLQAIAEEAGFSKGVMYSQFQSKADLFLTLLARRIEERTGLAERISAEHAGLEGLNRMLEAGGEDALAEAAWTRVLVEFRVLASRDPSLNARYATAHARNVDRLAAALERLCVKAELQPPFPPRVMAEFIFALATGSNLERAANPAALPVEVLVRMVPRALGFSADEESSPLAAHPRHPQGAD
jgi:AcrR family transcriptional regulator